MASSANSNVKYVYDLPFVVHRDLCRILDQSDKWEEMAGAHMGFSTSDVHYLRGKTQSRSPTEELLALWGQKNHTIHELFVVLSKMQHYQAMTLLKPFIAPKYHSLIHDGEESITKLLAGGLLSSKKPLNSSSTVVSVTSNVGGAGNMNFNIPQTSEGQKHNFEDKILNVQLPPLQGESKQNNSNTIPSTKKVSDSNLFTEAFSGSIPSIPYKELCLATNQFDKKKILGRGGFGVVFRGTWKNTAVAIKRIEQRVAAGGAEASYQAQIEQSSKELKILNSVRHDNILSLYGFSVGGDHPCLVYQLMPNGSLEDRLQLKEVPIQGSAPLSWTQRHNIACGTARGLQFLHTVGEKPLIHGDIKSANILLDANLNARIGDFGLAREGPVAKYTHIQVTSVHGTRPYLPEDYVRSKQISTKVDTFSFGIVLYEIATGQRAYDKTREKNLLKDLITSTPNEEMETLMDPKVPYDPLNKTIFNKLMEIAKECTTRLSKARPEMIDVHKILENTEEWRGIVSRAQSVAHSPNLYPSNPLEIQMMFDVMNQQRRSSQGSENPWNGLNASFAMPPQSAMGASYMPPQSTMGSHAYPTPAMKELRVDVSKDHPNQYLSPSPAVGLPSPQGLSPRYHPQYGVSQMYSIAPSISPSTNIPDYVSSVPSSLPTYPFPSPSPSTHTGWLNNAPSVSHNFQYYAAPSPNFNQNVPCQSPFVNYQYLVSPVPNNLMRTSPLLMDQHVTQQPQLETMSNFSSPQLTDGAIGSTTQHSVLIPTVIPGNTEQQHADSSYFPDLSLLGIKDETTENFSTPPTVVQSFPTSVNFPSVHQEDESSSVHSDAACYIPDSSQNNPAADQPHETFTAEQNGSVPNVPVVVTASS